MFQTEQGCAQLKIVSAWSGGPAPEGRGEEPGAHAKHHLELLIR
jgi:hypothetical protein